MKGDDRPPPVQQTTQTFSPEQRQLFQLAMPGIQQFAANVPQRYQGQTIAGFDPSQTAGQEMALGAAGTQKGLSDAANSRFNFFTSGDIWNPSNNPALAGSIDAATRPITEAFQQSVLPGIRQEAITTGNFGSSKQGIAEGQAANNYLRAVGDTSNKLVNEAYDTNVKAQLSALGLLPSLQSAAVAPAVTTSGVGDIRQNLAQAQLGQNVQNFNYDQLAPFLQSRELLSLLTGLPGGTVTSTANNPPQAPAWQKALGGAATGASLGTAIMPGIGTAAGAAGGAVLPFLF